MAAFLLDHLIYSVNCLLRHCVCIVPWRALPVPLDLYPWFPGCWACCHYNSMSCLHPSGRGARHGNCLCCGITSWHWCMRELFQKTPEKYSVCCKKFRELTGIRETFQPGQKYLQGFVSSRKSLQGFVSSRGNCVVLGNDSCRTVTLGIPAD